MTQPTILQPIDKAAQATALAAFAAVIGDSARIEFPEERNWGIYHAHALTKIYDLTGLGESGFYNFERMGDNLRATLKEDKRRAVKEAARGSLLHDIDENANICELYSVAPPILRNGRLHYRARYLCVASEIAHAIYDNRSHLDGLRHHALGAAAEATIENYAFAAALKAFPKNANGHHEPHGDYRTWEKAYAFAQVVIGRIKKDGASDNPQFGIQMGEAEFIRLFCGTATPMLLIILASINYLAKTPVTMTRQTKDVKPGTGIIKLERYTGTSGTPWEALPNSPTDPSQAVISEDAPWIPPEQFEGEIRAVATGFQDTAGNVIPDTYSERISIQRQATQPGANG